MQEQLITFETAKLAKEKGFEVNCMDGWRKPNDSFEHKYFDIYNEEPFNLVYIKQNLNLTKEIQRPTQSFLQKWLREKHNIHIDITYHGYNNIDKHQSYRGIVKYYESNKKYTYNFKNYSLYDYIELESNITESNYIFNTYEEALERGLQEGLKLIK